MVTVIVQERAGVPTPGELPRVWFPVSTRQDYTAPQALPKGPPGRDLSAVLRIRVYQAFCSNSDQALVPRFDYKKLKKMYRYIFKKN
jgi:hypothetical protein